MIEIKCPYCGDRPHSEFTYGGDASVEKPRLEPTDAADDAARIYLRKNPCGPHLEYWHHHYGCRAWLVIERDTLTHKVGQVMAARLYHSQSFTKAGD